MKLKDLDTPAAGRYAFYAARDARMKSYAAESTYSEAQKVQAARMKLALEMCYATEAVHVNYRAKFIALKVENPQVRDRKVLKAFESDWEALGIVGVATNQGIIYRIPKV